MRVVSLAPSSTATLVELGAAEEVVGVTTHCTLDRPAVGGWLNPDRDRLAALEPDLVCTCDDLQADLARDLSATYDVCHVDPARLDEVLASFETLGEAVGRPAAGRHLRASAEARLDAFAAPADGERPVVYCEEWSDPPMAAGNWVPEVVELAGGRYPFVDAGARSRAVAPEAILDADPDHVVLHICGHGDRVSPDRVRERVPEDATVHVFDDELLNQPSPRLLDGAARLAGIFSE